MVSVLYVTLIHGLFNMPMEGPTLLLGWLVGLMGWVGEYFSAVTLVCWHRRLRRMFHRAAGNGELPLLVQERSRRWCGMRLWSVLFASVTA